jgi:hypothetical protein
LGRFRYKKRTPEHYVGKRGLKRQVNIRHLSASDVDLANDQDWVCPTCGEELLNGEPLERHHITARAEGGRTHAALADAVWAGLSEAAELKGPDFDAVRERDDFRKLAAALAKEAAGGPELLPSPRQE